ncbi:MAG TPA: ORF6N domain-containing protein [Thermoanaerobaculia bacterium]
MKGDVTAFEVAKCDLKILSGGERMAQSTRKRAKQEEAVPETAAVLVPVERVERRILFIRGEKVILDADLAELYGVTTKRLNEQVRRNRDRFPPDFMFQLTPEEFDCLRSQNATSNVGRGGRRSLPFVFTEHGAIMAANILSSQRAIGASVTVVRAFVRLRQMLASHADLARKLEDLEKRYDSHFKQVFAAIRALMESPEDSPGKRIGY